MCGDSNNYVEKSFIMRSLTRTRQRDMICWLNGWSTSTSKVRNENKKPWGFEEIWAKTNFMREKSCISMWDIDLLQYHNEKVEDILVQSGLLYYTKGDLQK